MTADRSMKTLKKDPILGPVRTIQSVQVSNNEINNIRTDVYGYNGDKNFIGSDVSLYIEGNIYYSNNKTGTFIEVPNLQPNGGQTLENRAHLI